MPTKMSERMASCKRSSAAKLLAGIALAASVAGCFSMQTINEKNAPELFAQFSSGTLRLASGHSARGTNIFFADDMFSAARREDWTGLSKTVIEANSGDDLGYFYLGLSAEHLGYKDAARIYYKLSIDESVRQTLPTQCTRGGRSSYLDMECHGLELPQAAYVRLKGLH